MPALKLCSQHAFIHSFSLIFHHQLSVMDMHTHACNHFLLILSLSVVQLTKALEPNVLFLYYCYVQYRFIFYDHGCPQHSSTIIECTCASMFVPTRTAGNSMHTQYSHVLFNYKVLCAYCEYPHVARAFTVHTLKSIKLAMILIPTLMMATSIITYHKDQRGQLGCAIAYHPEPEEKVGP